MDDLVIRRTGNMWSSSSHEQSTNVFVYVPHDDR